MPLMLRALKKRIENGRRDGQPDPIRATDKQFDNWYRSLSSTERQTFFACATGWALDAMDVQIYSFAIPALIATWKLTNAQAGILGTVALLASALGGWIAGILCDRFGRVRIMQLTILWFAIFTFLSGFTNSYNQLFAIRCIQGLGFGGEWTAGSILIAEMISAQHRGKALGFVQSGWAIGWAAAAFFYSVFFYSLPDILAWRMLFWIGILPAGLIFFLRRSVTEPPVFIETRRKMEANNQRNNPFEIFASGMVRTTFLCSLLSVGVQGGAYAIVTWLPSYLKTERGLSVLNTGSYLCVLISGSFCGYIFSGYLADWIGRRLNFLVFAVLSVISIFGYTYLPIKNSTMLLLGFPLGFFSTGIYSALGPFFTELFPTRIRASGQGLAYNSGRAIGAIFPTLVGILSTSIPLGKAIGVFAMSAYILVVIAILLLPETAGKVLNDD